MVVGAAEALEERRMAGRPLPLPVRTLPSLPAAFKSISPATGDTSDESAASASRSQYRSQQARRRRRVRPPQAPPSQDSGAAPSTISDDDDATACGAIAGRLPPLSPLAVGPLSAPLETAGEHSLTDELQTLADDVVPQSAGSGGDGRSQLSESNETDQQLQLAASCGSKLFVEKGNKFQATRRRATATAMPGGAGSTSRRGRTSAVRLAYRTQRVLAPFGRFCCGLLAGLTATHFMFTLALLQEGDDASSPLAAHYGRLALPFKALLLTTATVCAVMTLDRYDVWQTGSAQLRRSLLLQDGGLAALIYAALVALSAGAAPLDDAFHLMQPAPSGRAQRALVVVSGVRAALALLAWALLSANPALDRLLQRLKKLNSSSETTSPLISLTSVPTAAP